MPDRSDLTRRIERLLDRNLMSRDRQTVAALRDALAAETERANAAESDNRALWELLNGMQAEARRAEVAWVDKTIDAARGYRASIDELTPDADESEEA